MRVLTTKNIDPEKLGTLWTAIGWKLRDRKKWIEVLSKSSFVCSVWNKNNLVGFGRILEDGIMCMFYDIAVHPDFQGKHKIGPTIMKILISQVKNKKYASIGLFSWEPNEKNNLKFYERFGFKIVKGMELIKYMERE